MFLLSLEICYTGDKTMNFYYIAQALNALVPNCAFGCGDTYDSIEWYSNNTEPLPTEDEVNAKIDELKSAEPARLVRIKRDRLLAESDWTQTRDNVRLNDSAWVTYRQELRDITKSASFTPKLNDDGTLDESSVTWPLKPAT